MRDPAAASATSARRRLSSLAAIVGGLSMLISAPNTKGDEMSYREARDFLAKHTKLVELVDDHGARVAICPQWQGRVMTSTCGGMDGPSFGFINRKFIEANRLDERFNNYGAEERMWLSPEGGQFSLWFKPGAEQNLDNWYTPPAINEGAWEVTSADGEPRYRLVKRMRFQNASATRFDLAVTRDIHLLGGDDLARLLGPEAARTIAADGVSSVGYETANTITNRGRPMTRETGLVSIWILGMLQAGPETVVVVPYRPGEPSELGPVVKSDYFGTIPPARLKVTPRAILLRADSQFRSKIGTSQQRARNVLGSIDFTAGVLTIVHFSMPDDPAKHAYVNNMWELPRREPYRGDVANAYNDGPPAPGQPGLGAFYEIESLSPAAALTTGQSLTHHHRTIHIRADAETLTALARAVLGVELQTVRKEMFGE